MRIYYLQDPADREYILTQLSQLNATSGTQYISFYVRSLSSEKLSKVKKELAESKNIKSKKTQRGVEQSLLSIQDCLNNLSESNKPYAIFAKGKLAYVVAMPESMSINKYHCGKAFDLEPLKGYSTLKWGLCVLDTQQVSIGLLENFNVKVLKNFSAFVPSKMKAGGQSQPRFEQTRKNIVQNLINEVSDLCNFYFKETPVSRILLGGVIPTTQYFYNENRLFPQLKKILTKPFAIGYTNPKGLEQLVEASMDQYREQLEEYSTEKTLFDRVVMERKNESKWKTLDQLKGLNYVVKQMVLTKDRPHNLYCETCLQIQQFSCGHERKPLDCPTLWFSGSSKFGQQFKRTYKGLYNVETVQSS